VHSRKLATLAEDVLADLKARDIRLIDVRNSTTVTDYMIIASGTSDRHVRSIADRLIERATVAGCAPLGVEGQESGGWVLVDLQDVVVHIMLPRVREFYKLESLWEIQAPTAAMES
jgi:ribosome-associated protein